MAEKFSIFKNVLDYEFTGAPSDYSYAFIYNKLGQLLAANHSANANGDMDIGVSKIHRAAGV